MQKLFFTALLLVNVCFTTTAQSIKDYIIPLESDFNKSTYYGVGSTGEATSIKHVTYYVRKGNGQFEITEGYFNGQNPTSMSTKTLTIVGTEVKLLKTSSSSIAYPGNRKKEYKPSITILKLPKQGQTLKWSVPGEEGDKATEYTASLIGITFNGEKLSAIKLIMHPLDLKSKMIYYYVKGIGLTDTKILNEFGVLKTFEKFDSLNYEDTGR